MRSSAMVVVGCIALGAACSSNGSVGVDACPSSGVQCESLSLGRQEPFPVANTVASLMLEDLPELEPTWRKSLAEIAPGPESESAAHRQLLTDRGRNVFLAWVDAGGAVQLSRLDDDGGITESSAIIAPPAGVEPGSEPPAIVKYAFMYWENDISPAFSVHWNPACKITEPCSQMQEQLLFSDDLSEAPERFSNIREVLRDDRGDYLMLSPSQKTAESSVVTKLNGTTRDVEWTQQQLTATPDYRFVQGGVALEHGRVALLMSDNSFDTHITVALDETGTPRRIGLERYDPRLSFVAFLASRGEPVVAYSTDTGVNIMRIHANDTVDQSYFAASDYAAPDLLGTAEDGDGNVYFLTHSGGLQGIRPTLCRATSDSADCVVLPPYIDSETREELVVDDVVARKGGVIYIRSGAHLLRLDFPA